MNMIAVFSVLIVLFHLTRAQTTCKQGDVRIVNGVFTASNGSQFITGQVQVCIVSKWAEVCSSGWERANAVVVCRQLGLSYAGHCINSCKGNMNTTLVLNSFRCAGDESRLLSCPGVQLHNRACTEAAGITCVSTTFQVTTSATTTPESSTSHTTLPSNSQAISESRNNNHCLEKGIVIGFITFIIGALIGSSAGGAIWAIVYIKKKNKITTVPHPLEMSRSSILGMQKSRHYKPFPCKSEVSPPESYVGQKSATDIPQQNMQGNVAYGQGSIDHEVS